MTSAHTFGLTSVSFGLSTEHLHMESPSLSPENYVWDKKIRVAISTLWKNHVCNVASVKSLRIENSHQQNRVVF